MHANLHVHSSQVTKKYFKDTTKRLIREPISYYCSIKNLETQKSAFNDQKIIREVQSTIRSQIGFCDYYCLLTHVTEIYLCFTILKLTFTTSKKILKTQKLKIIFRCLNQTRWTYIYWGQLYDFVHLCTIISMMFRHKKTIKIYCQHNQCE